MDINTLPDYFPFFFVALWLFIFFIISRMGWSKLAANYRARNEFNGTRVGIISIYINLARYNNAIILKYNDEGIYLQPIIFFRLFHPPILIPWSEIINITDKKNFLVQLKKMEIGAPRVASISLPRYTFNKLEYEFIKHKVIADPTIRS